MNRYRNIVVAKLAVLMIGLALGNAEAQVWPAFQEWTGRGFVSVGGGGQLGGRQFKDQSSIRKFDELALLETQHTLTGGGLLDVSGGLRLWRSLGASIGFSTVHMTDDIAGTGTVPNPLLYHRPRPVSYAKTGLKRQELAVHLSAVYVVPVSERFIVSILAGPTLFRIHQDVISDVELGPETQAPLFSTVTVNALTTASVGRTGIGGHIGFDGTFLLNEELGASGFVHYAGGAVDLPSSNTVISINVGGAQVGGGLKLFF